MSSDNSRYFYLPCDHLANHGSKHAVEVYKLRAGKFPQFIAGDYEINDNRGYEMAATGVLVKEFNYRTDKAGNLTCRTITLKALGD